jgi:hypothetical protein
MRAPILRWSLRCVVVASLWASAYGCDAILSSEPEVRLRIETDQRRYSIASDERVYDRLINIGEQPVYMLVPSYLKKLQWQAGVRWVDLDPWYALLDVSPRVVAVAKGDTVCSLGVSVRDEVFRGPGRYRFSYELYRDSALATRVPLLASVSDPFTLNK